MTVNNATPLIALDALEIADIDAGRPPSNKVEVKRLSRQQRARLKEALHANAHLDALTRDLLF